MNIGSFMSLFLCMYVFYFVSILLCFLPINIIFLWRWLSKRSFVVKIKQNEYSLKWVLFILLYIWEINICDFCCVMSFNISLLHIYLWTKKKHGIMLLFIFTFLFSLNPYSLNPKWGIKIHINIYFHTSL